MTAAAPSQRKLRILVAKPGLDGHDRGAKVVARALRDAGFEVIYTGLHQTPEMIASAAVQEDVDGVGLSIMSGAHNTLFPAVIDELRKRGANDVVVFGGGIIPEADFERLKAAGVTGVFTPGTTLEAIIQWVRDHVRPRVIRYQLSVAQASRRARTSALARVVAALAPLTLAFVLLGRAGLLPAGLLGAIVAAVVGLVLVRGVLGYTSARRRLLGLRIDIADDAVRLESRGDVRRVARADVARVIEVTGSLGGLRVESAPDARGERTVVDIPRGGEGWAEARATVSRWGPIEGRSRRGLAVRVGAGLAVVAGMFFLPFLFEDFVARSRIAAAVVVVGSWVAVRAAMRVS